MFEPGSRIGRFRVVGPVGRERPDGLFEVDDEEGRRFALRTPIADLPDDTNHEVTRRFMGDLESLRTVAHLNLVPLFDVFVHDVYLCMVVERVKGRSLAELVSLGQVEPRVALNITRQILDGIAPAHAVGLVHRDLRPGKVLLVPMEGWELVKVADVGLTTLREEAVLAFGTGALTGSVHRGLPTYQAPEQVRGRSVDARTDLYAIGTMLFEMLAGRAPFPDRDPESVKTQQLVIPPPKIAELFPEERWVTRELSALLDTALAKEREERFASTPQMIAAVDAAYRALP